MGEERSKPKAQKQAEENTVTSIRNLFIPKNKINKLKTE